MNTHQICEPCANNIRTNEAGGYLELAEEWREFCRSGHQPKERAAYHKLMHSAEDAEFLTELEARPMSSWSEAETSRYNELTGQSPELGSDALTMAARVEGLK